jgi:uncharacterized protein YjiS (DUF1127 family)
MTQIKNIRFTYQCQSVMISETINRCGSEDPMRTAILFLHTAPVIRTLGASRQMGVRAATWLKALIRAWVQTRRHHREVAILQTFDERMLRDVGLTRADVQWAASTPFWQDPAAVLKGRGGPRGPNRRQAAVPPAPSIVPGLPGGGRDLAPCCSTRAGT